MGNSARIVNSSGIESPPFEKVPVKRRKLKTKEIAKRAKDLSDNILRFLRCPIDKGIHLIRKFYERPYERNRLINYFMYCSIVSTVTHVIIQGIIISRHVYEGIFALMIAFLCIICVFTLFNYCFTYFCSRFHSLGCAFDIRKEVGFVLYFISLCVYLGLFCGVANFLRKNDYYYFIASLILFFSCLNIHGIVLGLTTVVALIYGIFYYPCILILYLSLRCCCNSKGLENNPTIYLYDPSKTEEKTCTICLREYKRLDRIRVCKIHLVHIFHEKCISAWLLRNYTCPLCSGSRCAIFY